MGTTSCGIALKNKVVFFYCVNEKQVREWRKEESLLKEMPKRSKFIQKSVHLKYSLITLFKLICDDQPVLL